MEDRADEGPVGQVAASQQIWIVAQNEIPRREVSLKVGDDIARRLGRREYVPGNIRSRGDDLSPGVQPGEAEVTHEGEYKRLGRMEDLLAALIEQALQPVPHHAEGSRIEFRAHNHHDSNMVE